jgi:hypothetical protein
MDWAILVPEALAYAIIAGISLVVGLYAALDLLRCGPRGSQRLLELSFEFLTERGLDHVSVLLHPR